jgi:hypothetical protein
MTTFDLTEKELNIVVIALGNLNAMIEAHGPSLADLASDIRAYLRRNGIAPQDIKELAVKFGISEKAVFSAGEGLQ